MKGGSAHIAPAVYHVMDILQIYLTFYRFIWHFTDLFDILQIYLTFYRFIWHFTDLIDILQIYLTFYDRLTWVLGVAQTIHI